MVVLVIVVDNRKTIKSSVVSLVVNPPRQPHVSPAIIVLAKLKPGEVSRMITDGPRLLFVAG